MITIKQFMEDLLKRLSLVNLTFEATNHKQLTFHMKTFPADKNHVFVAVFIETNIRDSPKKRIYIYPETIKRLLGLSDMDTLDIWIESGEKLVYKFGYFLVKQ